MCQSFAAIGRADRADLALNKNKKAQLSLTNPRDACEKFARFT